VTVALRSCASCGGFTPTEGNDHGEESKEGEKGKVTKEEVIKNGPAKSGAGSLRCKRFFVREDIMAKLMTKSELIKKVTAEHSELSKKDVKGVMETLATVAYKELKKNGAFLLPGFAKFVVIIKPATKERAGINPFTKEPTVFKARPARKIIRARPVKAAKDAV
jgi:DNA-binding protein HU-beta